MIKIENVDVFGWETAIRGMRNPMNSWDKSDSGMCCCVYCEDCSHHDKDCECIGVDDFVIGISDLKLMKNLSNAGNDHGKFLRMINVSLDIVAPLYWWKEFDTYKVGTVANSCSTMHKIQAKEFTIDDFSHEHLNDGSIDMLNDVIGMLNYNRELFLEEKKKDYWWQMIQLLPSSYNQRRTIQLNYAVLKNMYHSRKAHKLDEWLMFCKWIESLPYAKELIVGDN
ncbi:hypothetical protein A9CBEGH2_08050 [Amedibacterium intestinale]|uniref:hypothetical protein n=1 Tax=Amedibacterium intestinale TaxID=2583452 RepID=UPI00137414C2|nr:hypothetical protein [Amedibacterium intestinale]BBK61865.1 hypothetical protein A9CBEGH2_08050 [Amedibacterium intestinale]